MTSSISQHFKPMQLIRYTMPSMIMMMFMSIYTIADGTIVSKFLGDSALSALNIAYPVVFLVNGIGIMLGTGGSAIIAKKLGEAKDQEAKENFSFFLFTGVVIGLILSALVFVFHAPIIRLLGATDALYQNTKLYLLISMAFAPITVLQLMFQCYFSTAGKPQYSLILTIAGGVVNVVLDLIFIGVLHMGVEGAAIATGLGQCILGFFGLFYFAWKRDGLCFVKFPVHFQTLGQACYNGSSEMVSNLANAVVTLLFNLIMIRLAGEAGVAAITIVLYGQFLFNSLYLGFTIGVAPILSYHYGANTTDELQNVTRLSLIFISISSIVLALVAFLSSEFIVNVFVKPGTQTHAIACYGFALFSINYIFAGTNLFASSLFTALSDGTRSAILSFSRTLFWMVVCLLILPSLFGLTGVWLAVPVAEFLTFLLSLIFLWKYNSKFHYLR